jgi:hypothetical protein
MSTMSNLIMPHQELLQTFADAVEAFNDDPVDWKGLEQLFHDDVTLKNIGSPPHTYDGKQDVIDYIKNQVTPDEPRFEPIQPLDVSFHGNRARISGYANWTDHDDGKETQSKILYYFMFTKSRGKWLILSLWASPD